MSNELTLLSPPLIDLPVISETYCSQAMTNDVLASLWADEPEAVAEMAYEERRDPPWNRTWDYYEGCHDIEVYLNKALVRIPHSNKSLVVLHLLYEVSRRLRKSFDLTDVRVFGIALAPSIEGPFPPLMELEMFETHASEGMTQPLCDEVCRRAYDKDPTLMYELSEWTRRLLYSFPLNIKFEALLQNEIIATGLVVDRYLVNNPWTIELTRRLIRMCAIDIDEVQRETSP